ncbi:MAG: CinA family nicotinamide mononucleotide deamidase-related protein [Tannerellaceae bacterium]|jgi:nicotinamide-nucleotide amidase|nr:CinA family nicotinamide mononucleotide deamidase-related protein [Tannerellaceae bacterium]
MNVQIITIGDELLIGQVVDTNSAWMGQELDKAGFRVIRRTAVGDVEKDILEAIGAAINCVQIVLLTGGIGPTKDDITQKTLCKYFDSELYFSEEVYANIIHLFDQSGRTVNELTRAQAMVPRKCTVIQNKTGTAPCTWFEKDGKILVSMPGVPYEMKWLMTNEIIPRLKKKFGRDIFIRHKTTWTSGFTESALAMQLAGFEEQLPPFVKLAYLPQPGLIRLRLSACGKNGEQESEQVITALNEKLHKLIAGHILATEDKAIEEQMGEALLAKGLTMGTAESCTGGRIASMLTAIPGSSRYFAGGVVSYSNDVKRRVLGVSEEDLSRYGAVSRPVVEQMSAGAIRVLGCDCAVSTSGIAGPDGGTPEKPAGTVWIAAAYKGKVVARQHRFAGIREMNIVRASNMALLALLELIRKA